MKSKYGKDDSSMWQDDVKRVAAGIRRRVLEHTIRNNGGYLSQACSSAEILATLYVRVMNLGKINTPLVPQPFPGVPGPDNQYYFTGASFNGPGEHFRSLLSLSGSVCARSLRDTDRNGPYGGGGAYSVQ